MTVLGFQKLNIVNEQVVAKNNEQFIYLTVLGFQKLDTVKEQVEVDARRSSEQKIPRNPAVSFLEEQVGMTMHAERPRINNVVRIFFAQLFLSTKIHYRTSPRSGESSSFLWIWNRTTSTTTTGNASVNARLVWDYKDNGIQVSFGHSLVDDGKINHVHVQSAIPSSVRPEPKCSSHGTYSKGRMRRCCVSSRMVSIERQIRASRAGPTSCSSYRYEKS